MGTKLNELKNKLDNLATLKHKEKVESGMTQADLQGQIKPVSDDVKPIDDLTPAEPNMQYKMETTNNKLFIVYAPFTANLDDYIPEKVLMNTPFEMGDRLLVKEWTVYFGKPSKWVPKRLYEMRIGGWVLLEEAPPYEG